MPKISNYDVVANNITEVIKSFCKKKGIPVYEFFYNIDGWSYDKANYYLKRNRRALGNEKGESFINTIMTETNCSIKDILKDQ